MVVIVAGMLGVSVSVVRADSEKEGHMKHMRKAPSQYLSPAWVFWWTKDKSCSYFQEISRWKKSKHDGFIRCKGTFVQSHLRQYIYSKGAVKEAFGKVSAAEEKMVLLRAKTSSEVSALLTTEQSSKFLELIS